MRDKRTLLLIILLVASVATRFAFFGHPNQVVFDEVHFGKFASAYYTHSYYFDIHPPLGKLLIAGFAKIFNFQPEYSFAQIGQAFPDNKYLLLRLLPTLAGTMLPIVIFLLALELGFSKISAFGAGALVILENALLTQSRYILLDMFLLVFGFSALFFYFRYRNNFKISNLLWMAIFGGLAISIKWTGLAFLGLAGIVELISHIQTKKFEVKKLGQFLLFFGIIPLTIYFSIFVVHFSLLTKPGDGDAFMSPQFRQENVFKKFVELNIEMYKANQTLTATHPYSSKWYTWPFMIRPIYYWLGTSNTTPTEDKIYFLGNPFIWWGSTVAVFYLILSLVSGWISKRKNGWPSSETPGRFAIGISGVLLLGWVINYLPFIGIGRVMFLYHYMAALIFGILIFAYLVDQTKRPQKAWIPILAIAALAFLYFAPLSYGLPLEAQSFQNRMWLPSWQ